MNSRKLFVVCFCVTVAFCFGSVVLADICDDPSATILRLSNDPAVGGISPEESESMNYYFTCPAVPNNTTAFLADAIVDVEAGAAEVAGIRDLVEITNPTALCLGVVDGLTTNLAQSALVLKLLFSS